MGLQKETIDELMEALGIKKEEPKKSSLVLKLNKGNKVRYKLPDEPNSGWDLMVMPPPPKFTDKESFNVRLTGQAYNYAVFDLTAVDLSRFTPWDYSSPSGKKLHKQLVAGTGRLLEAGITRPHFWMMHRTPQVFYFHPTFPKGMKYKDFTSRLLATFSAKALTESNISWFQQEYAGREVELHMRTRSHDSAMRRWRKMRDEVYTQKPKTQKELDVIIETHYPKRIIAELKKRAKEQAKKFNKQMANLAKEGRWNY